MTIRYGFNATLTARPGMGERLAGLLLTALDEDGPAASEHCLVYLVCRSASDPDVVHVTEGWTGEAEHRQVFAGPAAQALVSRIEELLAAQAPYTDYVPVGGKAAF
ncbi:Antibiotic biosynthesis monooxygenase [Nonomuraea coxensis DSM 45129]|uniref:Antibiotic biosynthesis monooxygenase n=1 Tax=Nonomuraea coxensis DSM 45129 TaxID=1122611 RepID=A0ABX8TZK4_9ACTN|nr:antibiotic biosynthesis monooxygenase [Nonomuraea coxensis]QYC40926.1 Antibiotic biosynthesis monooxygenase [Nonomuraea coxensis DSM 45129]